MYLLLELALTLFAIACALWKPNVFSGPFHAIEKYLSKIARQQRSAVLLVGVVALAARLAVIPVSPIPSPAIQDEFGHLLIADTFAHGKITNPTHPLWIHFESFNIIERPTYQGMAQPGQGILLAAGKLIGGHPFWGVWFSLGLLCASICWMLQAWVPPEWALVGGSACRHPARNVQLLGSQLLGRSARCHRGSVGARERCLASFAIRALVTRLFWDAR